ncbi:T4 family baseplate hub assembly chaperone [Paraburkholderia dipogonis]
MRPALRACHVIDSVLGKEEGAAEALPLGQRDARLLELQRALFGPRLDALTRCPECDEQLELNLSVDDLRVDDPGTNVDAAGAERSVAIDINSYHLRCRLPNSRDLAQAALVDDVELARQTLLQCCLLDARFGDTAVDAGELPDAVVDQLGRALGDADPQAISELALQCPACGHAWSEPFDIANYLLDSLSHWAERCLDQVHTLARAYGWSEAQILALSPVRRACYLGRVLP